jgi:hypothetical protein
MTTAEATLGQVSLTLRCTPDHWSRGRKSAKKKARKVQRKTLLVLVVDESGSMAGTFGRQVVPALTTIVGQVLPPPPSSLCHFNSDHLTCGHARARTVLGSRSSCHTWRQRSSYIMTVRAG